MEIFSVIFFIIILTVIVSSIKIVKQSEIYVIERLGSFHRIAEPGVNFLMPVIDTVRAVVSLSQQKLYFPALPTITNDNNSILVKPIILYKIVDPEKYVYSAASVNYELSKIALENMRRIVGNIDSISIYDSTNAINSKLLRALEEDADRFGIRIHRAEIKLLQKDEFKEE